MVQELLIVSRMETTPFSVSKTDLAEQLRLQLAELTELFEEKKLELHGAVYVSAGDAIGRQEAHTGQYGAENTPDGVRFYFLLKTPGVNCI